MDYLELFPLNMALYPSPSLYCSLLCQVYLPACSQGKSAFCTFKLCYGLCSTLDPESCDTFVYCLHLLNFVYGIFLSSFTSCSLGNIDAKLSEILK